MPQEQDRLSHRNSNQTGRASFVRFKKIRRLGLTVGLSIRHAVIVDAEVLAWSVKMDGRKTITPPTERMPTSTQEGQPVPGRLGVQRGARQSLLVLTHSWLGWALPCRTLPRSPSVLALLRPDPLLGLGEWSKNLLVKEVLPFWGVAFFGLLLSTVAARFAGTYTDAQLALNLVNLAAFGLIWVFKLFLFDRLMFGGHHHALKISLLGPGHRVPRPSGAGGMAMAVSCSIRKMKARSQRTSAFLLGGPIGIRTRVSTVIPSLRDLASTYGAERSQKQSTTETRRASSDF